MSFTVCNVMLLGFCDSHAYHVRAACGRRIGICGHTSVSEDGRTCFKRYCSDIQTQSDCSTWTTEVDGSDNEMTLIRREWMCKRSEAKTETFVPRPRRSCCRDDTETEIWV